MPWTPSLSVGVDRIDEQHKTWFDKAEKLLKQEGTRRVSST